MKILITGSSGFLGSRLAIAFRDRGHEVTGTARRPGTEQIHFVLGEDFDRHLVTGFDAIVHAAHNFDSAACTLSGTQRLFQAARETQPAPRQLFVGSYSARTDAVSEYGRVKYALERIFLDAGETVIRPGLVIGNGGMFGRNLRTVMTIPVVPLLNGGRDEVPVLSIRDAIQCLTLLIESRQTGPWNLFHPDIPSMRDIIEAIAAETGRHRLVMPVPLPAALTLLRCISRLGLPLPIREDNIRSLQVNQTRIHKSDLARLGVIPQNMRDAVRAAVLSARASD
jgi:nucleoside-diphosphate-sugar epimerase